MKLSKHWGYLMTRHSYCKFCGFEPEDWKTFSCSPCEGCIEDLPLGLTIPVNMDDWDWEYPPEIIYDNGDGIERSFRDGNLEKLER